MKREIYIIIVVLVMLLFLWRRAPLIGNEWSKQTIYVGLLDILNGSSEDDEAHALWIDHDSTDGVFIVKDIADEVGVNPTFAVIADGMTKKVADSLVSWQKHGAGIVLHGLRHERWKEWDEEQIVNDINQSLKKLHEQGFDTTRILKMIIPPHGCNTRAIRKVIGQQGCQMISGATLVNPDRHVFQLGRISIETGTDLVAMQKLLQEAYKRKAFVIFGTHSSIPEAFSVEKTREVLIMAKEMGFYFGP